MAEHDDLDPEGISADQRPAPQRNHSKTPVKQAKKKSLVGDAFWGVVAAVLVGMVPGWHLPGVLLAFSGQLVLAWQAHFAAGALASLIRVGHDAPVLRRIGRVAEGGTGAYVSYLMYQNFPLDPSAWGLPGFAGTIIRYLFLAGAVAHGIKALAAAIKLVFGKNNEKDIDPESE